MMMSARSTITGAQYNKIVVISIHNNRGVTKENDNADDVNEGSLLK